MKVFMVTDMEGVAGVVSFPKQSFPDGKYFEQAKKLETAEVNAAVDGLSLEEAAKMYPEFAESVKRFGRN